MPVLLYVQKFFRHILVILTPKHTPFMRYLLVICLLWLTACEDAPTPCTDSDISICFEGFDSTDLADIELKVFQKGTGFQVEEETILTGYAAESTMKLENTCSNFPPFLHISTEKDYQINFRNAGQVYKLHDIQMFRLKRNQENGACYNNVSNYYLDGEKFNTEHYSGSLLRRDYNIVIEKRQ